MKQSKLITAAFCLFLLSACNSENNSSDVQDAQEEQQQKKYTDIKLSSTRDFLISVANEESPESEGSVGFINQEGDTVIPMGKYSHSWTDTLKSYAFVYDKINGEAVAIDRNDNVLFDVVLYDNGPDYLSDGLFRVKRNGKIGYANEKGEIVIPCQYQCAFPFEDGQAKVAYNCEMVAEGEHQTSKSEEWFYIDLSGKEVK